MKIIDLEIKNIRGIRELTLKPNKNNFVVWGTNGTGKSAVVDAIDFLLTGQINRLLGEGTRGITMKKHGAHIDCDDLSGAYVRAVVLLEGASKPIEIKRCMDNPDELSCPPENTGLFELIQDIAQRGQHVLTRREILKFITSTEGDRAKDIQSLMSLDDIEAIRSSLVSVRNGLSKDVERQQKTVIQREADLATRVGLPTFEEAALSNTINDYRALLNGDPISELSVEQLQIDIKPPATLAKQQDVNISVFEKNLAQLTDWLAVDKKSALRKQDEALRSLIADIHTDAQSLRVYETQSLTQSGLDSLDESGKCPLCDTQWEAGELEAYLQLKLKSASIVKERVDKIREIAGRIQKTITVAKVVLSSVINSVKIIGLQDELQTLLGWETDLAKLDSLLLKPVEKYHRPPFSLDQVQGLLVPANIKVITERILSEARNKYPKSTPEQTAWDTLTKLSVDLKQLEDARLSFETSLRAAQRATILHDEFIAARNQILGGLYTGIKDRFVEMYRELHKEDEGDFDASLEPSDAALKLEVDFYGRGVHPPHALHSEGHQDSMGVCLFLALSEKLTHGLINLIILDDVVMSVDASHRRELCKVLNEYFPDSQFLITTHDQTWAMQLKSNGVVRNSEMYEFFDWSLDSGPHVNDAVDVWERIAADMQREDIASAAAKLRRGSEQFFFDVCGNLAAPVPLSKDARYELGDLLISAMRRFKELLSEANKAAISWGADVVEDVQLLSAERKAIYSNLGKEQWAVNVNVHYNQWANFTKNDFQPVIDSFHALFNLFICEKCGGTLYLVQDGKALKNVRCPCNHVSWNLEKKKNK